MPLPLDAVTMAAPHGAIGPPAPAWTGDIEDLGTSKTCRARNGLHASKACTPSRPTPATGHLTRLCVRSALPMPLLGNRGRVPRPHAGRCPRPRRTWPDLPLHHYLTVPASAGADERRSLTPLGPPVGCARRAHDPGIA